MQLMAVDGGDPTGVVVLMDVQHCGLPARRGRASGTRSPMVDGDGYGVLSTGNGSPDERKSGDFEAEPASSAVIVWVPAAKVTVPPGLQTVIGMARNPR